MKREIKFRGICKNTNKWVYGDLINSNIGFMIINDFSSVDAKYSHKNKIGFQSDGIEVIRESISQYTGLKDANGVDIYEGDIIDTSSGSITHVEFKNGGFFYTSYYSKNFTNDEVYFGGHHYLNDILTRFKVIGNIYQNPELIN